MLIAALALFVTTAAAPLPPADTFLHSQYGQCPDGTVIEAAIYDGDPNDPRAIIVVYKRGDHVIAILNTQTRMVWIAAARASLPLAEVQAKWPTPCDIPNGTPL